MTNVVINYWAVLVSGIAAMAIGAIWYSPAVFGKVWMNMLGLKMEEIDRSKMGRDYFIIFIAALVVAYVLAHFISLVGATDIKGGMTTAFWAWLGFVVAGGAGRYIFPNKPFNLFLLDNGERLITFLVMGIILGAWH